MVDAMDEAEVDSRTAVDIIQWLREFCSTHYSWGHSTDLQIYFFHKPKVRIKGGPPWKYNIHTCIQTYNIFIPVNSCAQAQMQNYRGRPPIQHIAMGVGLCDTSHTPGGG